MIVFVTAYDPATHANHAVARRIVVDGEVFLAAESANKAELMRALRLHDGPLFIMTHGLEDRLLAQGGDAVTPALTTADVPEVRLAARPVFAHACRAARDLGSAVARAGSVFWGYLLAVNAPEDAPEVLPIFADVFSFIKSSFAAARGEEAQDRFFNKLYERCRSARERLYELRQTGNVFVPYSADHCLVQIQQDLVVWSPGKERPRQPPWAREKRQVDL